MSCAVDSEFRELISGPDDNIDLATGALLIARSEYPDLDLEHYQQVLDNLAVAVLSRLPDSHTTEDVLRAMNAYLFIEVGFTGNVDDYYDPRNSFLNDVLERKLGIPITLAIVYIQVGQRLGVPLAGVCFPGHFLVRVNALGSETILDPFFSGGELSKDKLKRRLQDAYGVDKDVDQKLPSLLVPASNKSILERMLRNLKGIYLQSGELVKCLRIVEHLVVLRVDDPIEIRDRGLLFDQLECHAAAARDYQRYLASVGDADDTQIIRERLAATSKRSASIH